MLSHDKKTFSSLYYNCLLNSSKVMIYLFKRIALSAIRLYTYNKISRSFNLRLMLCNELSMVLVDTLIKRLISS